MDRLTCAAETSIIKNKGAGFWPKLLFLLLVLGCVLVSVFFLFRGASSEPSISGELNYTLVIDPGHGGRDGGAISDDGTRECDINLAVSHRLRALSELFGLKVVMTRTDDSVRREYAEYSEHEDLEYRTSIVNGTPAAILFSIHQNDFPTSQPSGSQVFYAATPGSETLGKCLHRNLIDQLDPQNRRVAAPAPASLYLTSHVRCPAVLVECGFMSNNFDVQKLTNERYQSSLALIMTASLLQVLSSETLS